MNGQDDDPNPFRSPREVETAISGDLTSVLTWAYVMLVFGWLALSFPLEKWFSLPGTRADDAATPE